MISIIINKKVIFFALFVLFSLSTAFADYSSDYKSAANEGKTWVIVIGEDWCQGCMLLANTLKNIDNKNLIVTKLTVKDTYAQKIINAYNSNSKYENFGLIPDWIVYKYSDGKFKFHSRNIGSYSKPTILKMLDIQEN